MNNEAYSYGLCSIMWKTIQNALLLLTMLNEMKIIVNTYSSIKFSYILKLKFNSLYMKSVDEAEESSSKSLSGETTSQNTTSCTEKFSFVESFHYFMRTHKRD